MMNNTPYKLGDKVTIVDVDNIDKVGDTGVWDKMVGQEGTINDIMDERLCVRLDTPVGAFIHWWVIHRNVRYTNLACMWNKHEI